MGENKTSDAQIAASRRWEKKNPERTRYLAGRRAARSFIRTKATLEDLDELMEIMQARREMLKDE
ncbi:Uncharacterised protein [Aedoeadaptatus ivorii]|uniref:Uncharacterized protein n=1 Tax=Aedoeadaptatus ivorii TaxID=54006 RepID=A0A448V257_9FIRM|nr:hypothetical protein [Peptoniphilus ivorii]MDQ0508981.1 hypothetical protein [Peptoniphilus ivorii]VEJ35807.1 Uncharacterised protein [Peptoniphilus ivorii]